MKVSHVTVAPVGTTQPRIYYLLGTLFAIVGCFLPWWGMEACFDRYRACGINFNIPFWCADIYASPVVDHGGLLILSLCLLILVCVFYVPVFVRLKQTWVLASSAVLFMASLYYIVDFLVHVPPPTTTIYFLNNGLYIVLAGSLFTLIPAILDFRNRHAQYEEYLAQADMEEAKSVLGGE